MGLKPLFKSVFSIAITLSALTVFVACDKKNNDNNNGGGGYVGGYGGGFGPTAACMQPYQTTQAGFNQTWAPFQRERIRPYSWSRSEWGGRRNCDHQRNDRRDFGNDSGRDDRRDSGRDDNRDFSRDDSRYGNEMLHRYAHLGLDDRGDDRDDNRGDSADRPNRRPHDRNDDDCDDNASDIDAPPVVGGYPQQPNNSVPPIVGGGYTPANGPNGNWPNGGYQNQQFCGCQGIPNTVPACGPSGMTCVPAQSSYNYAGWGYSNNQFNPIQNSGFRMNNGCASQVAQICTPIGSVNGNYICQNVNGAQYGQGQYGVWIAR